MTILLSEWGRILASASAYERAHFFGNVDIEVKKTRECFSSVSTKMTRVFYSEHKEAGLLMFVSLFMTGGIVSLLLFYISSDIEPIELFSLAFYFIIFMGSLEQYALQISNIRSAVAEYKTYDEFVERVSPVADKDGAKDIDITKNPSIEFRNVSFSYEGKEVLRDISFKIDGGQMLGLVGPSGCGKSTIMRLLMRFYAISEGQILVNGKDISEVKAESLRKLFSVVTQNAHLFNGTVRQNIAYGKLGSSEEAIAKAADMAELKFGDKVEDITMDKECGENGAKLSGGQQQRVSIARAMLKNGSIYLLDEPTTGLDGVVAQQLQKTLDSISKDSTTICITHYLSDLKRAQQILYLDAGKIVERGTYDELMQLEGEFYQRATARQSTL